MPFAALHFRTDVFVLTCGSEGVNQHTYEAPDIWNNGSALEIFVLKQTWDLALNCKGWGRCHRRWAHRERFLLQCHHAPPHLPFLCSSCHPNGSWHLVYFQERNACTAFAFFFLSNMVLWTNPEIKMSLNKNHGEDHRNILNLTYAQLTPVKPNCVLMITLWTGSSKQTAICKAFRAPRMASVGEIPLGRFLLLMCSSLNGI